MALGKVFDIDHWTVFVSTHAARSAAAGFAASSHTVEIFAAVAIAVPVPALVGGVPVGIAPLVLAVPRNQSVEVACVADGIPVLDEQIVWMPAKSRHAAAAMAAFVVGSSSQFL